MSKLLEELKCKAQVEVWGNCHYTGSPSFEGYETDLDLYTKLLLKACIEAHVEDYQHDLLTDVLERTFCMNLQD